MHALNIAVVFQNTRIQMEKCTLYKRRIYLQTVIYVKGITLEVMTIDRVGYPLVWITITDMEWKSACTLNRTALEDSPICMRPLLTYIHNHFSGLPWTMPVIIWQSPSQPALIDTYEMPAFVQMHLHSFKCLTSSCLLHLVEQRGQIPTEAIVTLKCETLSEWWMILSWNVSFTCTEPY